jgi:Domain of unknown function (DUF2019)
MTRKKYSELSAKQLVEQFKAIALAQDEAMLDERNSVFNRLFDEMELVRAELLRRDGDQRSLLMPLLMHPNAQVRLKSAITLLAVDRGAALTALQTISDNNEYPQAANARGMLRAIAEGRYLPT